MHNIEKLPRWAQKLFADKDKTIQKLEEDKKRLRVAHHLLMNHEWFTIPNPINSDGPDVRSLFFLDTNCASHICSLGKGDILLVGLIKDLALEKEKNDLIPAKKRRLHQVHR